MQDEKMPGERSKGPRKSGILSRFLIPPAAGN
jgi:hypothetical protein